MEKETLNLFFNIEPNENLLQNLDELKKLKKKEIFEITDFIIENYPKELEKEWEKWTKDLGEAQKETKENVAEIVLFILVNIINGNVNEDELKEDFEKLEISTEYIDYFTKKIKESSIFQEEILTNNQPYKNKLRAVHWRIDKQNIGKEFETQIALIEFNHISKGEKQVSQIELNLEELKKVIGVLTRIEKRLCKK